jgi:hypothetical protein
VAGDLDDRVAGVKREVQIDVQRGVGVAIGVDVGGKRGDLVAGQRQRALAAEEAQLRVRGLRVLE